MVLWSIWPGQNDLTEKLEVNVTATAGKYFEKNIFETPVLIKKFAWCYSIFHYSMEMRQKRMGMGQFQIFQEQVCEKCPNVKLVSDDEELEIEIERGMDHGHEIEYFGEGEPQLDGEPGDLKVVLR